MPFDEHNNDDGGDDHNSPERLERMGRLIELMIGGAQAAAHAFDLCDNCFMKGLGGAFFAQFAGQMARRRPNEVSAEDYHRALLEHFEGELIPIIVELMAEAMKLAEKRRQEDGDDEPEHNGTH